MTRFDLTWNDSNAKHQKGRIRHLKQELKAAKKEICRLIMEIGVVTGSRESQKLGLNQRIQNLHATGSLLMMHFKFN